RRFLAAAVPVRGHGRTTAESRQLGCVRSAIAGIHQGRLPEVSAGPGHALAYPVSVTIGAVAVCAAAAPFADVDQAAALIVLVLPVLGYSAVRLATALGRLSNGLDGTRVASVRRVRHQHRLVSRSWLEIGGPGPRRWLPVYFDPVLLALVESE